MSLFKELMDARKEEETHQGEGKVVDMGAEETATPVPNSK